jgi:IS30 family transposase
MAKAGQLRAEGWSHRQIATYLGVHHKTIQRDLHRLAAGTVALPVAPFSEKSATKSAKGTNVVAFARRKAE